MQDLEVRDLLAGAIHRSFNQVITLPFHRRIVGEHNVLLLRIKSQPPACFGKVHGLEKLQVNPARYYPGGWKP